MTVDRIRNLIRTIPDVPSPGIMFRDITPLLADSGGFELAVTSLASFCAGMKPNKVIGVEARGFIFAAPVAVRIGAGFVPVRKPGKLPWTVVSESYALEYGTDTLEIHADAVGEGDSVVIVDDVLATGGTAAATIRLVESLGATVAGLVFLIELTDLGGRKLIDGYEINSVLSL